MIPAALACALLTADPGVPTPEVDVRAAYLDARAEAGRDADSHVRLALWCERNGLDAERVQHLGLAVLAEPDHAAARALLGLVRDAGRWVRPSEVGERVRADAALAAALAEYQARRARAPQTADGQWALALWCERNGLVPEARAHLASVVRLDPSRDAAWRRLGCVRHAGRWMSPERAAAAKAEADARRKAEPAWKRRLSACKDRLERDVLRDATERELADVTDPHAVPAVWNVFALGTPAHQARAVQILGQIDGPASSRALAVLAVFAPSESVRAAASETLARRDPREALEPLVALLADEIRHDFLPVRGPGQPGALLIEGPRAFVLRVYAPPPLTPLAVPPSIAGEAPGVYFGRDALGQQVTSATLRDETEEAARAAQRLLLSDLQALRAHNLAVGRRNGLVANTLANLTAEDLGSDAEAWRTWWADQLGSTRRPDDRPKPTRVYEVPLPIEPRQFAVVDGYRIASTSCFAAGTPVHTRDGLRPIESLQVGDIVLAQDPASGALDFQPVTAVHHNPPAETFRLALEGGESVCATAIHRFWVVGRGWAMTRDLRPGDPVRLLGSTARVASVTPDAIVPVFNLDVDDARTFFAGRAGLLVHDNRLPDRDPRPFDAAH